MAGVGAGTGALGSVIVKLTTLLGAEYTMLKRVRKDIAFLERELRRMQTLVNVLADMEGLDKVAKDWKGSMRDLSYDMEECIDRFMLRLDDGEATKRTARQLKTLFTRHGIGTQIKELKARIMEEGERRQRLNLDNYVPTTTVAIDPRLAAFHGVAKGLVAMDGRRDEVIYLLMDERVELKVMAIVGGGGLGKTTLAMEAYRKIGGDFRCQAHVTVSRSLDLKKLLKDVLSQIDKDTFSKCKSWDEDQLIRQIQHIMKNKRYLLVIDDIWKEQDWKIIEAVFPNNCNGSRIIATTRIANVAKSCCSNSHGQLYQMQPMNEVDSRRLFFQRIFNSDNSCHPQLEEVSARILKKCGGLPLAIITIASLLANKPQNPNEWERLEDSIGTGLLYESDDDGKEDWYIPREELKLKWIAEGFIGTKRGNLYQEAESYFNELVNRSMIQQIYDDIGYGFDHYCQVHDMVLDLIISLSDEDNFATVLNGLCNSLPSKIRRFSLQSSGREQKGAIQAITRSKLHVRSLNVFGETKEIPQLVDFQALRVFHIAGYSTSWENEHIRNIGSFYQPRYLRIHSARITELPEDIGKLQKLETLDLQNSVIRELPSTIARLQNLVPLFVSFDCLCSADMFGSMRSLEEVSNICKIDNPEKFSEDLGHLTKLTRITTTGLWIGCYIEKLGSSLMELGNGIQYLCTCGEMGEYLFRDPCCTFPHLQHLKLIYRMKRVPKGMVSLTNILELQIEVSIFDEEGLHILMGMPSLANLQLEVWESVGVMTVSSNGFKLLEVLHYTVNVAETTGIKFAAGAMPALGRLHLCWSACYLPFRNSDGADMGFEHLSSLAHLEVETNCHEATVAEVEAVEDSVEKAIALHPYRHTLQLHLPRTFESYMFDDEEEREKETK